MRLEILLFIEQPEQVQVTLPQKAVKGQYFSSFMHPVSFSGILHHFAAIFSHCVKKQRAGKIDTGRKLHYKIWAFLSTVIIVHVFTHKCLSWTVEIILPTPRKALET